MLASGQTLEGSFSAVWTATIARKDALFRIFRDLQSRLSGEKKVHALFFSRKKNTFGGDKGWQILRVKSARIEGG